MALCWGVASSGKICHDFVCSLAALPGGRHRVAAVGARSLAAAERFAAEHGIPRAHEGYRRLAEDGDIDVVYIGNLHPHHFEVAQLMLEHGKHILCEKPLTMTEGQTRRLLGLARARGRFAMEGLWSRFFPAYEKLNELITSGELGDIRYVSASFGTPMEHVDRINLKSLGGGTILDLGIYTLQLQQLAYRGLAPLEVRAAGHVNADGVDESAHAVITYPGGGAAVVSTSSRAHLPNEAVIVGTRATARLPHFWAPTTLIMQPHAANVVEWTFELPYTELKFNFPNSVGLSYEAEHVRKCIANGEIESPIVPHEDSIKLAQLMDTMRKQIGVVYAEDVE